MPFLKDTALKKKVRVLWSWRQSAVGCGLATYCSAGSKGVVKLDLWSLTEKQQKNIFKPPLRRCEAQIFFPWQKSVVHIQTVFDVN